MRLFSLRSTPRLICSDVHLFAIILMIMLPIKTVDKSFETLATVLKVMLKVSGCTLYSFVFSENVVKRNFFYFSINHLDNVSNFCNIIIILFNPHNR